MCSLSPAFPEKWRALWITQLDAAGVREIVGIHGAVRRMGGELKLLAVPGRVRYLLAASSLADAFDTVDFEHQAVASLTSRADGEAA